MNTTKNILLLFVCLFFVQCTDLDIAPEDATTENETFTSADAYRSYLAKIYASYSLTGQDGPNGDGDISIVNDEGFTSYIRVYWKAQELTTDEAVIAWTDAGIRDLHEHSWSSENQFVRVLYYRIALIVSIANDFLKQSSEESMTQYGVPEGDKDVIRSYRHEARFLRALAYWHALDFFRNIPLETQISADLPVQVAPSEVFDFIETELLDIADQVPGPRQNEYGRADQGAIWMLLAKLYMNAEVMVGADRYQDCLDMCTNLLDAGYTLEPNYQNLFNLENQTSNEIIFALNSDGKNSQSWGITTFLIHAAIGGTMNPPDYGVVNGWGGVRTTSSLVEKFTANNDPRGIFFTDGQTLEIDDIGDFTDGYAVPKYTNLSEAGQPGSDPTHADTDYPMFRLGDVYLMYAEAVLRTNSGDTNRAVDLINELRERAFGNSDQNISTADLDLDFILDERARELYWEAHRRIDLIRFNQLTENSVWPWKGGVKEGRTTESFRNIFPIPASDLLANPRLEQNEGY